MECGTDGARVHILRFALTLGEIFAPFTLLNIGDI